MNRLKRFAERLKGRDTKDTGLCEAVKLLSVIDRSILPDPWYTIVATSVANRKISNARVAALATVGLTSVLVLEYMNSRRAAFSFSGRNMVEFSLNQEADSVLRSILSASKE